MNKSLALLATLFNLLGLTFEALELHLWGMNIALIFHGIYCLLTGYLVFRSSFLPRVLGVLMAIGGVAWLTDLSTPVTNHLSPYNVVSGFVGEGLLMLWLLVIGLNGQRWHAQTSCSAYSSCKSTLTGRRAGLPTSRSGARWRSWFPVMARAERAIACYRRAG